MLQHSATPTPSFEHEHDFDTLVSANPFFLPYLGLALQAKVFSAPETQNPKKELARPVKTSDLVEITELYSSI
jgi:hypothetical protein